jgi:putative membrane protein
MVNSLAAADKARLGAAVAAAEKQTRADIVLAVTEACDDYAAYPLAWAIVPAFIAAGAMALLWPHIHVRFAFLCTGMILIISALLLHWPKLRGALVPSGIKHHHAQRAARLHFAEHVAGRTVEGTGLLIFVAIAEHYVEIIPDTGIARVIPENAWAAIIGNLVAEIGRGSLADGLSKTVENCAVVLAASFPRRDDDKSQIEDAVIYTP